MTREEHEKIINKLLDTELPHSERTELLQNLRVDYNETLSTIEENTVSIEKLSNDNNDLIISNSKLFRQIGIVGNDSLEKEVEETEFSETVTIEELEG